MTTRRARRAKRKTMKGGNKREYDAALREFKAAFPGARLPRAIDEAPKTMAPLLKRLGIPYTLTPEHLAPRKPSELERARMAWEDAGKPDLISTNLSGLGGLRPETYYRAIAAEYLRSIRVDPIIPGNVVGQGQKEYNKRKGRVNVGYETP